MATCSKDSIHVDGLLSGASCTHDCDSDDDGLDELLLEASQQYEAQAQLSNERGDDRFVLVDDDKIAKEVELSVPEKNRKQTQWASNVWCAWRQ